MIRGAGGLLKVNEQLACAVSVENMISECERMVSRSARPHNVGGGGEVTGGRGGLTKNTSCHVRASRRAEKGPEERER